MFNTWHGKAISTMFVQHHLADVSPAGVYETTVPQSLTEGKRNWSIQQWLSMKNFMGNVVTRVELPHDDKGSHNLRVLEERRQLAMPWNNSFTVTETDGHRLNNPSQQNFVNRPQLYAPSTSTQWRAMMTALSAAFGSLGK